MYERKKKPTLEQVRMLFPFEVPDLARAARVEVGTVYQALLMRPIHREDAEKIVKALSTHTHLTLSLGHINIVLWEDYLTLWLIHATNATPPEAQEGLENAYHLVYARDQHEATLRAQSWLAHHTHLPVHTFTSCPDGFVIGRLRLFGLRPDDETDEASFEAPF
ncbi:hypothetical protein [Ktedonospora formicarum]|uniref:Uncharacterized protein n=1 Tax=Ktedonospora formicarum TaxID=2778364 RepID=A0A8J3IEI2_9CHLR|nr:hypothetical protein [Ktedonospora formicarum]GHO50898.1 hypothetical protein KSX_90610 [Ktedonospora formicarum]